MVQFNLEKWFAYLTNSLKTVRGRKTRFQRVRPIIGENAVSLDCGHAIMEAGILGQEVYLRYAGNVHHTADRETVTLWRELIETVK